jgi:hypothetical protein
MNAAQLLSEGSTLLHCSGRLGASCIPISTHVPSMHTILCFWASTPSKTILTSSPPSTTPPIAALEYRSCGELCGENCPCNYQINPAHAEPKTLSPPSEVKATKLLAFAPQATSLADAALRTGSDQLFDALVYCCTVMLPEPAVARNWPV